MKCRKRLISGALALAMAGSLCTAALPTSAAALTGDTFAQQTAADAGSIAVTVRFDLPQTRAEAEARDITLKLTGPSGTNTVSLSKGTSTGSAQVSMTAKNTEGEALTTEERIGYYTAQVSGLATGTYDLELTGKGYASYTTQVALQGYSQHLVVGTGDGTFSLGDVNADGRVDGGDLEAMDSHLGTQQVSRADYDLNGDGKVDITDLAYVNYVVGCVDTADIYDTAAIVSGSVETVGFTVKGGSLDDLFEENGAVTLEPVDGTGQIEIPITLDEQGVEMSEIVLISPEGSGALEAGTVTAELTDGTEIVKAFDISAPEGVHAIGREVGQSVVTIGLGKKAAVKKVAITVTAVKDQDTLEYAALTQVEFLKDVVPAAPQIIQVKGLAAAAGDGKVDLTWNTVNNVTGYTVHYGTDENALTSTMSVSTNKAAVTGLTNETTYYFQVTAKNSAGSVVWTGGPSEIAEATPKAAKAPGAPSNIRVTSADRSLRLSWGTTKDATYYQVFYRVAGSSQFIQFGGNYSAASTVITGLVNGKQYEVAVKAGNSAGTGPYSSIALGTPALETIELPELPEDDRIPNSMITKIEMPNPAYYDASLCPNFTVNDLIDSDANTYWIARQWWESSTFTYTFSQPHTMSYLLLVPYLGDNHKYAIKTYGITAYDADGNELMRYTGSAVRNENNYIVCTFPVTENVSKLAVSLAEHEGNGYRVSVSEIAFYSSGIADDITALFADGAYTKLASGVTAQKIAELSDRLNAKSSFYLDIDRLQDELDLAESLLASQPDLGLVKNDFQSRSGSKDSAYGQSASNLQPLGVSVRAGATVAVYAELPGDAPVYVVPTQYFGESGIWKGAAIQLTNGRNYITVPQIGDLADERGGMLYLTYAGAKPEEIKIQVRGDGDTFRIPVLELSDWYTMGETARKDAIRAYVAELQAYVGGLNSANLQIDVRNATEISTPSVLLSIPADRALAGLGGVSSNTDNMVEKMYQNVLAWEDVLFVANKVQGIIDSSAALNGYRYPMTTRQNIRYMRMFAGAFMYAAGNHVGVGYGSTSALVCGKPVSATGTGASNGLFGWGISHEIGHNMDKLGKAEITNNIYSLAVQAWDGGSMAQNTRLTLSNIWPQVYDKVSVGRPGAAGNVFVQLGMYWQLHLAYDNADEPLKFYNDFFKEWKKGAYSGYTYDERVALIACQVTNRDLTEFFTRWGMTLGDGAQKVMAGYAAEDRAVWYLNDKSYQLRLGGEDAAPGTASASAQVSGNKVILTITNSGDSNLLGYEISRNGEAIGFTTDTTYVDDLGVSNNLTYQYSVTPVDLLGDVGDAAESEEIRIAYDVVIDPELYAMATSGGTVAFTAVEGTMAVTGIKVTGDTSGIAVKIDGASVALGGFSETGAAYFNRPSDSTGNSIWTYDAAVVQVTGVPADAVVELLAYPGDRLDFYPGATVGILKDDYKYGDGADDIIPAGTLIVTGIYRGDPAYNTVELQAVYDLSNEVGEGDGETRETVTRTVNGYGLLFAEINGDGTVSDTTDGFWIFVPDWDAEHELNLEAGWETPSYVGEDGELAEQDGILYPMEIRAVLYRTNEAVEGSYTDSSVNRRVTSQTLWISFPDEGGWPEIVLTGAG